ncbi:hypothetical protein J1614_006866 [Plenodomus biglobosus]|nr:hypothetical protein J1614_006866 [Plenodomus biglobosus]
MVELTLAFQNSTIERYSDSPPHSRSTSPVPSQGGSATKSHTLHPQRHEPQQQPPAYTDEEPYRDDPQIPTTIAPRTHPIPSQTPPTHAQRPHHIDLPAQPHPYTDASTLPTPNDDGVPLAHLLVHPAPHHLTAQDFYPLEAPPPYSAAVRETLIHHVPPHRVHIPRDDGDEEAGWGLDMERPDDVRHDVEKVVAMFVVASLLLMVSGVLGWLALGSGLFI